MLLEEVLNVSLQNAQENKKVFGENVKIRCPYVIHVSQNPDPRQEFTDNLFSQVLHYFAQVRLVLKS